jgi:hypothetical protein
MTGRARQTLFVVIRGLNVFHRNPSLHLLFPAAEPIELLLNKLNINGPRPPFSQRLPDRLSFLPEAWYEAPRG